MKIPTPVLSDAAAEINRLINLDNGIMPRYIVFEDHGGTIAFHFTHE